MTRDGRRDFDFLVGRWTVLNRCLTTFSAECDDWYEFPSMMESRPILDGLGNMDTYTATATEGHPGWTAAALRLYDPEPDLWRIWWATSKYPGQFGTPMEGRFSDSSRGLFYCDEELDGQPGQVRFVWTRSGDDRARWEQAYRFGNSDVWHPNWVMDFTRVNHR